MFFLRAKLGQRQRGRGWKTRSTVPIGDSHLAGSEDVGVVVEVAQRAQRVLVLLELDEAVTQRLSHHLVLHRLLVVHHPTLRGDEEVIAGEGKRKVTMTPPSGRTRQVFFFCLVCFFQTFYVLLR